MPIVWTSELAIDVALHGPVDAPALLLLHGWPDDASTWDGVIAPLTEAGLRLIVPTLRGFGGTHFITPDAPRTANSAILAMDAIALMDALGIQKFMVAGHDWGSNIAEALAVGWPDRVDRIALLSTPPRLGGMPTPPFAHAKLEWYHWFMATARGAAAVAADRRGFARRHWDNWSPRGWYDEATFRRVARSWDNPDWVEITLHSYRSRWDEAPADPRSLWLERKVADTEALSLHAIYVQGLADGVNPPSASAGVREKFTGPFALVSLPRVGHFPQREAPATVAAMLAHHFTGGAPVDLPMPTNRWSDVMTNDKVLAGLAALAGVAIASIGAKAATVQASPSLTQVARFDHQVTGVSVASDGRRFVNFPRWTDDAPVSVAEVMADGTLRPYPDLKWNSWRNAKANELPVGEHFVCVQSIVADGRGSLWVLDPGAPGNEKILPGAPKLVKIDLATDSVTKVISVPEDVALQGTYLNDIRFSPDGRYGYITDSGTRGAIIVVDLKSGKSWRALDGHPSTQIDKSVTVVVDGKPLRRADGRQPAFAADGIALSNDGKTLYYQALTGKTLYSIATAQLREDVAEKERTRNVRTVARTQVADGLWMSKAGTLYISSPGDNSVKRLAGAGVETVLTDRRLRWPDTFSEGPDGMIYITASHIQDTQWFTPGAPPSIRTELFSFKPGR